MFTGKRSHNNYFKEMGDEGGWDGMGKPFIITSIVWSIEGIFFYHLFIFLLFYTMCKDQNKNQLLDISLVRKTCTCLK